MFGSVVSAASGSSSAVSSSRAAEFLHDRNRRAVDAREELLDARVLHSAVVVDRVVVRDRGDVLRLIAAKPPVTRSKTMIHLFVTEAFLIRLRQVMMELRRRHRSRNTSCCNAFPRARSRENPLLSFSKFANSRFLRKQQRPAYVLAVQGVSIGCGDRI